MMIWQSSCLESLNCGACIVKTHQGIHTMSPLEAKVFSQQLVIMMLRRVIIFAVLVVVLSLTNISLMGAQLAPSLPSETYLLIVNNDGSIYKYNPASRNVVWHTSLSINFISFNHSTPDSFDQREYFLPNFDGSFIYVSQKRDPMAISRKELEQMLNRCFDRHAQYFLYDSVDYHVLNMETGSVTELKKYLDEKNQISKGHYVIRIDRKYLKSLNDNMQEKWSILSSQISILSVKEFIKNSKAENDITQNKYYRFYRNAGNSIEIRDLLTGETYQLQSQSSFITIFSLEKGGLSKHQIEINLKNKPTKPQIQNMAANKETSDDQMINFHIAEYQKLIGFNDHSNSKVEKEEDVDSLEFCINSIKTLENESNKQFRIPQIPYSYAPIVDKEASFASQLIIGGIVLFLVGICLGYLITKIRKEMQFQIQSSKQSIQKRIQKMEKQLQESKKQDKQKSLPYTIKYEEIKRSYSDVKVYVSTILSKEAEVSVFPVAEYSSISSKIQIINSVNNKRMLKVWHHEIKQEQYLIFTDKVAHTLQEYMTSHKDFNKQKIILQIVEMLKSVTNNGISISCLSPHNIVLDNDGQFKYNSLIPKYPQWTSLQVLEEKELTTNSTLFMLANIVYYVCSQGKYVFKIEDPSDIEQIKQSYKKIDYTDEALVKLQKDLELNDLMNNLFLQDGKLDLNTVEKHLFFWDIQKKLAFVNEFSNYMETHLDDEKVKKFELTSKDMSAIPLPWSAQLPKQVLVDIVSYRKYDFYSIRDIIRVIRNKSNHFHEVPQTVRRITGRTKEDLCQYYLKKFPKLLYFMYVYGQKKKWKLHGFL